MTRLARNLVAATALLAATSFVHVGCDSSGGGGDGPAGDGPSGDGSGTADDPGAGGTDDPDPGGAVGDGAGDGSVDCGAGSVAWAGACIQPGGTGDNLHFVGTFDGSDFNELVEVEHVSPYVFYCAGTKGLSVYDAPADAAPTFIIHSGGLGDGSHPQFPRCQHLTFGEMGDPVDETVNVFVTNRGDETQPTPWIKWIRFEDGIGAIPKSWSTLALPVVSTLWGHSATQSFEGIDYDDGYIYAATHQAGLSVVNATNSDLSMHSVHDIGANAYDVVVSDGLLVVATFDHGLFTFDLSDPTTPELLGQADSGGSPTRLAVQGDFAYVAAGAEGLEVYDISDPTLPVLVRTVPTTGTAMDVNVDGDFATLATWTELRVIDISSPADAHLFATEVVPTRDSFSRVLAVDITGHSVYAGEWTALLTYQLDPTQTPADVRPEQQELFFDGEVGAQALIVANDGWHDLEISEVSSGSSSYKVVPSSATIPPQGRAVFEVIREGELKPTLIRIHSNDPDEPTVDVDVVTPSSSSGIGPGDSIPSSWTFQDVATGQMKDLGTLLDGKVGLLAYFSTF